MFIRVPSSDTTFLITKSRPHWPRGPLGAETVRNWTLLFFAHRVLSARSRRSLEPSDDESRENLNSRNRLGAGGAIDRRDRRRRTALQPRSAVPRHCSTRRHEPVAEPECAEGL